MCRYISIGIASLLTIFSTPTVWASNIPIGDAANYAILYSGLGNNQLSITNVTIQGNIGVGNTGKVANSCTSTVNGRLDFSSANTGQFSSTNGANVGPTSVNYGRANVANDLSALSTLSSTLGSASAGATNVSLLNATTQIIDESGGTLLTINGIAYRVFNISSVHDQAGQLLTINGDGSGDPVVFDFASNTNLQGDIVLNSLTADQVLWNFYGGNNGSGGPNLSLNNNASSYPLEQWSGILLDPNGAISVVNANLNGRVFGGGDQNMQIVSGDHITAPSIPVPEPSTFVLNATCFGLLLMVCRRHG
jgi:hypothetical protein